MAESEQGAGGGSPSSFEDTLVLDFVASPPPDEFAVLVEIGARLQTAPAEAGLKLGQQIEIVDKADREGRELMQMMEARFLELSREAESPERIRVWEAASAYATQLASAYLHLVRQFQTYSKGWAEVGDRIPLVVARALRATSVRLKWQLMRYLPVEKALWQTLAQLWAYVEDKGMTGARVLVYEDKSTLQREFLKPLMLAVSGADSLPPPELDIADRITRHLDDRFELQRYAAKGCHFYVDIDLWTPPARFTSGTQVKLGSRFFGPGSAVAELEQISAAIAAGEMSPRDANLEGVTNLEPVIEVLTHLGSHWWIRRQERTDPRRRTQSQIGVIQGFEEIVARLSTESPPTEALEPGVETWGVENESEGGYGAVLPIAKGEHLRVGEVLGVKPAESRDWAVGIVRRLTAQDGSRRYIGIQLLARGARIVNLQQSGKGSTALMLPSQAADSVNQGEISLLLPAGSFSPDAKLEMEVFGRQYTLEPRMLIENGDDFDMARFRIVERKS